MKVDQSWLDFLREQFPKGSQVRSWELDDPEHISIGTLEQIDEEGRFHTRLEDGTIRKLALGEEQFSVQPPEPTLLKLYMPLTADFYGRDKWGDVDETGEEWDGRTLLDYEDHIQGALVRNRMPEEKERGVMRWYDKQDSLNVKVRSAEFNAEERNGQLWGVAECRVVGELSPEELSSLKDYLTGQASDGWGEGFEQREIEIDGGELYVHLWQWDNWSIQTEQERFGQLEHPNRAGAVRPQGRRGPAGAVLLHLGLHRPTHLHPAGRVRLLSLPVGYRRQRAQRGAGRRAE